MKHQQSFERLAATFAFAAVLGVFATVAAGQKPKDWNPTVNPANFTTNVTNSYFPLVPGRTCSYQNAGNGEALTIAVTTQTKTVMGVQTVVVRETHTENGQVVEISENWYAQDLQGNVWYFGEFSQDYVNNVPSNTDGSWEAGVNGALPGIIMKASPQHGDTYFQEYASGVAEDMATVLTTNETMTVPAGTYTNVLRTKEWTPLEGSSLEHKYYAPDVGLIMEQGKGSELVLVSCN